MLTRLGIQGIRFYKESGSLMTTSVPPMNLAV